MVSVNSQPKTSALVPFPDSLSLEWSDPGTVPARGLDQTFCPLSEFTALRKRLGVSNILFPRTKTPGDELKILDDDPVIKKLKDYQFSNFSMEPASINFLKNVILQTKPQNILEFGSGISTSILSHAQQTALQGSRASSKFVSIDQSEKFMEGTKDLLTHSGCDEFVHTLVCPIQKYRLSTGDEFSCYEFDEKKLHDAFHGTRPDMVLIDGPVGGGPHGIAFARFLTVTMANLLCADGALILLDDAYRDTEIQMMVTWPKMYENLDIMGVKMVGKGTMIAAINRSN